ncbi:hypothetical protein KDW_59190 [Dictyobacter vulcani]|uniref:Uncharacterized protein n=1 Tax=Dictyobacter vulcani TaxID=2607529 RepID=A0A5J4KYV8_9CHLR|nr:hypothetical protein KDW_59190 [Dictyobacter vulcani]
MYVEWAPHAEAALLRLRRPACTNDFAVLWRLQGSCVPWPARTATWWESGWILPYLLEEDHDTGSVAVEAPQACAAR